MLKQYDPYFRQVPNNISESTKTELLKIAFAPDAFIDISYKISFFKLPSKIQKFNKTGLDCVCQMLRVSESGSKIHKDRNRYNEYENLYMPRQTVINYPLTVNADDTFFYDDEENFVCNISYNHGGGAILNTGEKLHNVNYTGDGSPRISFQLCFEQPYEEVCKIYKDRIKEIIL
jgi:hypothetical protein